MPLITTPRLAYGAFRARSVSEAGLADAAGYSYHDAPEAILDDL